MTSDRDVADGIMAAHFYAHWREVPTDVAVRDAIAAALASVREEEREACARVVQNWPMAPNPQGGTIAAAIRSRQTPTGTGDTNV